MRTSSPPITSRRKLAIMDWRVPETFYELIYRVLAKQARIASVARRIFAQQRTAHGKVYSVHAPEVECIAKGKLPNHYEFGCKVRIVTTSRRGWIVGIDAAHNNPYDGATLKPALAQVKRLTGVRPEEVFVDKGFRGQRYHPTAVAVYISGLLSGN